MQDLFVCRDEKNPTDDNEMYHVVLRVRFPSDRYSDESTVLVRLHSRCLIEQISFVDCFKYDDK